MDVLDGSVVNIGVKFAVISHPSANKNQVIERVIGNIQNVMKIQYYQIDQPILLADLVNVIINTQDVISLSELKIINLVSNTEGRIYSDVRLNIDANTFRGMVIGPPGSIFELKYPDDDIIGSSG